MVGLATMLMNWVESVSEKPARGGKKFSGLNYDKEAAGDGRAMGPSPAWACAVSSGTGSHDSLTALKLYPQGLG